MFVASFDDAEFGFPGFFKEFYFVFIGDGEVEDGAMHLFDDVFPAEAIGDEEIVEVVACGDKISTKGGVDKGFDFFGSGGC